MPLFSFCYFAASFSGRHGSKVESAFKAKALTSRFPIHGRWSIGHAGSEVLAKPKVEGTSKAGKYPGPLLSLFCRKRRSHFSLDSGNRAFQKASPEGGEDGCATAPGVKEGIENQGGLRCRL